MTAACVGSTRGISRGWLVFALLALVVSGLVGMHGLGAHGHGLVADSVDDPHASSVGMAIAEVTEAKPTFDISTIRPRLMAANGGSDHSPLAELCLAVVSLAGLVLLLGLRRPGAVWPVMPYRSARARPARTQALGPDPPSLAELSLLRS